MKKIISFLLVFTLMAGSCMAESSTRLSAKNNPIKANEINDAVYQAVVQNLNSDEYYVENVSSVYISEEYLEELAFNSETNVFFGYSLDAIQEAFEGRRYVFTIGENNQTVVREWEAYQDPLETVIRNVAVGAGVMLIAVTITVVTGGNIIAVIATGEKVIKTAILKTVTSYVSEYAKTGDPEKALETAAVEGSEKFKWGAIVGGISKVTGVPEGLVGAARTGLTVSQAAAIQNESKYPNSVIKEFNSVEEYNIYRETGLYAETVGGHTALIRSIDWEQKDETGRTNLDRISMGINPVDPEGNAFEVFQVGQQNDPVWAVLTEAESQGEGKFGLLHENLRSSVQVNGEVDNEQKAQFWKDLSETIKQAT